MGELLIGTSGYDYAQDWRGVFYPQHMKPDDFLPFYASQFNAVELNFSYYSIPTAQNLQKMIDKTAGRVRFSIKGHQSFTHCPEVGKWPDVVKDFIKGIEPLLKSSLLTCVLLQFPQSFYYETERRRYLAALITAFGQIPVVAEFRHESWQKESVYEGLEKMNAGICITDMPDMKNLPKFKPLVIAGKGYMRFHGRNRKQWYGTNSRDRYDFLYTDQDLAAYKGAIEDMVGKSVVMQVFFNNHAKGAAAVNAKKLQTIMVE
jgi:uncharacterized protein YecE (DUF72 family)